MRVPKRRGEAEAQRKLDLHVTPQKLVRMQAELKNLVEVEQPYLSNEVHRTGQFGDFSENAEYKEAKAKLRRVLGRIDTLKYRIAHATVIDMKSLGETVQLGTRVWVQCGNKKDDFGIVGGSESNPSRGYISHASPLGQALVGAHVGETVVFQAPRGEKHYQVLKIEPLD